ncbi:MAG: hypothetical protein BWY15_02190 [Firmicutes bacterium ADurb.Bin193]|nr:MAG: hypothetical protein BWY15_02190 [Firmicutes bacterium ADurb.Bin193]
MANGHGGKRPGAGRPRKPLAEKLLEGNPGKRKPKVLDIAADSSAPVPEYPERLAYYQMRRSTEPTSQDIWQETVAFLEKTGCLHMINPAFIEEYALLKSRFYEVERAISTTALIYDDEKKGGVAVNPGIDAVVKYYRLADLAWMKIWDVVSQNSEKSYGATPHDDLMKNLLKFNREG